MQRRGVNCRFRKDLDADLIVATKGLESGELSELVRNGLRIMLGIRTTKKVEVREQLLTIPEAKEKTAHAVTSKPAVYRPNNRTSTKREQ